MKNKKGREGTLLEKDKLTRGEDESRLADEVFIKAIIDTLDNDELATLKKIESSDMGKTYNDRLTPRILTILNEENSRYIKKHTKNTYILTGVVIFSSIVQILLTIYKN